MLVRSFKHLYVTSPGHRDKHLLRSSLNKKQTNKKNPKETKICSPACFINNFHQAGFLYKLGVPKWYMFLSYAGDYEAGISHCKTATGCI